MNKYEAEVLRQHIEKYIAPLRERIEKLEAAQSYVIETDWAAIGRQHRAPSTSRPQRESPNA